MKIFYAADVDTVKIAKAEAGGFVDPMVGDLVIHYDLAEGDKQVIQLLTQTAIILNAWDLPGQQKMQERRQNGYRFLLKNTCASPPLLCWASYRTLCFPQFVQNLSRETREHMPCSPAVLQIRVAFIARYAHT